MTPTIGRIIHVRIGGTDEEPVLRPAIIVRWWSGSTVNAQVLLDGTNDLEIARTSNFAGIIDEDACRRGVAWLTSISEGEGIGYWRWPARG